MSEHTPTPWNIVEDYGRFEIESRLHSIATVSDHDPNHAANARLISAAPDLLKALERTTQALKDILGAADNGEPYTAEELEREFIEDYNAGYEAIRKARGE